jgi:hypothetical protein
VRSAEAGFRSSRQCRNYIPSCSIVIGGATQRLTQQYCPSGVTRSCRLRLPQHLGSGKDSRIHQHRQVQHVTGPRVHRPHAERPFYLHGGGVGLLHNPIDPHLPNTPPKRLHQGSDELVGHRTTPLDPTEASSQAECLCLADHDGKLPVPCHLVQHDGAADHLVLSPADPDDPHLGEPNICSRGHGEPPQLPVLILLHNHPDD